MDEIRVEPGQGAWLVVEFEGDGERWTVLGTYGDRAAAERNAARWRAEAAR